MAEIRFDRDRMNQIHNRVGEVINQLQNALNSDMDSYNNISSCIQSTGMSAALKKYAENNVEQSKKIVEGLTKMDEFLQEQMTAYAATDADATQSLSEVDGLLNQLQ